MIRLFLVEDEKITRDSICNNIDWAANGIHYLGDAPDGELALPQILEKKPDILLCDIKMPFMDGLELSRLVKEQLPQIKIILLSGHSEFDYARQAISLGINEYLLKPVSSVEVLCTVQKVQQLIQAERAAREQQLSCSQQDENSRQRMFFIDLCGGYLSSTGDIIEQARKLNFDLSAAQYRVLVLRPPEGAIEPLPACPSLHPILVYPITENKVVFILQANDETVLHEQEQTVRDYCQTQYGASDGGYVLVSGPIVHRLTNISKSYIHAVLRLHERVESSDCPLAPQWVFRREDLLNFLRTGTVEKIEDFWLMHPSQIQQALQSTIYRNYFYAEIFFTASQFAEEINVPLPKSIPQGTPYNISSIYLDTPENIIQLTCRICHELIRARDSQDSGRYAPVDVRARNYIEKHFQDPQLSVRDVAEGVAVSPNYLSTAFKEKTGKSFSQYLSEVRMEHAKHLLFCTELRTGEIARQVGFSNINYFSVIFKKTTGMTPSQFRTKKGGSHSCALD